MKKTTKNIIIGIAIVVIIGVGIWLLARGANSPGVLDGFARCLKDKGAVFYGAFWCPHCQNQKALFGNSARLLPYVECSMPDGQSQTLACSKKGVESYPTWEFPDGTRETGEISLARLAEKTGCVLPPQ